MSRSIASSSSSRRSTTSYARKSPDLATRLSTVGGFSAGSGRDTFLTWNRGGLNKEYHQPGKERYTFNHLLRGGEGVNHSPKHRKKQRPLSSNPTGRFRPKTTTMMNMVDRTYGKKSVSANQFSVAEIFKQSISPSRHTTPKQNRAKHNDKIRRHIQTCSTPVSTKRAIFNDKCKSRRQQATQWERHTSGRVRVKKENPKFRNCHSWALVLVLYFCLVLGT